MRTTTIAAGLLGCTLLLGTSAEAQSARHYDCSKPGNANKSICKNAAAAALAAPGATAPVAAPTKTERHYDCSKAGNAKKAACKDSSSAPAAAPAAAPATSQSAKPSLLDRLRGHKAPASAAVTPAAANSNTAPAASTGSLKGKSITNDPAGATGQCKDGTYTHATHHSGACSSHGGVAKWMNS